MHLLPENSFKKQRHIQTDELCNIAEYISKIDNRIVLIDGNRLTELMIDNNVGVSILKNYEIKKIDSDYFTDEDKPLIC